LERAQRKKCLLLGLSAFPLVNHLQPWKRTPSMDAQVLLFTRANTDIIQTEFISLAAGEYRWANLAAECPGCCPIH
jgi:hypothetical protein